MAGLGNAYEYEKKRMHDTYGEDAEGPSIGRMVPVERTITERLADFGKQVAEAGHQLHEARIAYRRAVEMKQKAETRFVDVSEQLLQAVHEHREGTPENVPYQP
jgi:hypothetical protein